MAPTIKLVKPPGREYYTSGEVISGTVVCDLKQASNASRIVVYLEGKLKTAVRPIECCQEAGFRKSERVVSIPLLSFTSNESSSAIQSNGRSKLFVHQKILCAPKSVERRTSEHSFGPTKQALTFELEFPALISDGLKTQDDKLGLAALPPSFSLASNVLKVSVSYTLRVVFERPGLLRHNSTTRCNVEFRPLSGVRPCLHHHGAPLKVINYLSVAPLGAKDQDLAGDQELPPYTPSLSFEVDLPSCKTICPGERVQVGMAFVIPAELRHLFATIWITSLEIRLKTTTTVVAGSQKRTHVELVDACNVKGVIPLDLPTDDHRVKIPDEIWRNHTYPRLPSSFRLCSAQRAHELDILVDFACSTSSSIHSVRTRTDIVVESNAQLPTEAPPNYD